MWKHALWRCLVASALLFAGFPLAPAAAGPVAQAGLAISVDRGQGAWYTVNDPLTINFSLPQPGYVRIVDQTSQGSRTVYESIVYGVTGSYRDVASAPEGQHTLRLELFVNGYRIGAVETTYQVGAGSPILCNTAVNNFVYGLEDRWLLNGVMGARVTAVITTALLFDVALYQPNGTLLAQGTGGFNDTTLPVTGLYTIVVRPSAQGGGTNYSLSLSCHTNPTGPALPPGTATYRAGWNLVGGPTRQTFPTQLFVYDPLNGRYDVTPAGQGLRAGQGGWAYFTVDTTVQLTGVSERSATVWAPADQWVQIGNPNATQAATVTGADVVFAYNPTTGKYDVTVTLNPGQGAWATRRVGGAMTIATP